MFTTDSISTTAAPPPPPPPAVGQHAVPKTLKSAANLANLLPTGTVLAFQTLTPAFSNRGTCRVSNKFLTASIVFFCSAACFLSSFTDSFTDSVDGKLYYGIATRKGLLVFNRAPDSNGGGGESRAEIDLSRYRIRMIDVAHAVVSLLLFVAFAFCDVNVQRCFFFEVGGADLDVVVTNLPLAAGLFATIFFMLFPTTRRGVGHSDLHAPTLPTRTSTSYN